LLFFIGTYPASTWIFSASVCKTSEYHNLSWRNSSFQKVLALCLALLWHQPELVPGLLSAGMHGVNNPKPKIATGPTAQSGYHKVPADKS
jgi:hypothetical protein